MADRAGRWISVANCRSVVRSTVQTAGSCVAEGWFGRWRSALWEPSASGVNAMI